MLRGRQQVVENEVARSAMRAVEANYGSRRIWQRDPQLWRMRRRDWQLQTNMAARLVAVENEVAGSATSD